MNKLRRSIALVLACALVLVALSACKKRPAEEPVTVDNGSIAASSAVPATAALEPDTESQTTATGDITTPKTGSAARTALMNAARAKLGTTSQFYVYQLYVQGDTALGDIETVDGGVRSFVVWSGPQWEAVWSATFGSHVATAKAARSALPGLSDGLLGKVRWDMPKPPNAATLKSNLSTAVKKWSDQMMSGVGSPYKVTLIKIAQSSDGSWWGHATVQPTPSGGSAYESLDFWCTYSGGAWTGAAQDPEPPAPSTYFPADVIGPLF